MAPSTALGSERSESCSGRFRVRGTVGQVGPVAPLRRPCGRAVTGAAAQLRNGRPAHAWRAEAL